MSNDGDTLEQVAREIVGAIHFPKDFNTLEMHANLKKGLEIPLMGIASMPDVLNGIYSKRIEEDSEIRAMMKLMEESKNNGGIEHVYSEIKDKLDKEEETGKREVFQRLLIRASRLKNAPNPTEQDILIKRMQMRLLSHSKRMRYEHAVNLLESMVRHLYQISDAIEGENNRARMGLEGIKALVLHEQDMFKKMFPEKKSIRERFHIPGAGK